MKYIVYATIFIASCAKAPSNEIEAIGEDVLRAKQGLEIQIYPIPKQGTK